MNRWRYLTGSLNRLMFLLIDLGDDYETASTTGLNR